MLESKHRFTIRSLGLCQYDSPLAAEDANHVPYFVDDGDRILCNDKLPCTPETTQESFELAGARRRIFFSPQSCGVGMVTCGGLCPGMNDVIRGLVMELHYRYGVKRIIGFRHGYQGCAGRRETDTVILDPATVSDIHEQGGTLLGSSRGPEEASAIVDNLVSQGISILFVIGGDGTMRGALAISKEIQSRGLPIAVVGIPKTIDNDIQFIDKSFGFDTAYAMAVEAIYVAHNEARSVENGVGLVKLMGRYSGFIACHAALATSHVNFVLIPEVRFALQGESGFLAALDDRLKDRSHAVIVVAEGAGQDLISGGPQSRDASGNVKSKDIGTFLVDQIKGHRQSIGITTTVKYIDPSYLLRGGPAIPSDSVLCFRLAQSAVHAGMSGKTDMIAAQWHGRFVHVPMELAIKKRKQVDAQGELWASVLESTGQAGQFV